MYLLTLKNKREEGVYAVDDQYGNLVLFLFEEEDEDKKMIVIEIDDDLALKTCKAHNYKYAVITSDDIIVPPRHKQ